AHNMPPTRDERERCTAARDAYFACLDARHAWLHGLRPAGHDQVLAVDPPAAATAAVAAARAAARSWVASPSAAVPGAECRQLFTAFEDACLPSWVLHFCTMRVKDLQRQHVVEHAESRDRQRATADGASAFWEKVSAPQSQQQRDRLS
ncbi:hypothetical protein HK405_010888, partial [Cladochytrium tenue]